MTQPDRTLYQFCNVVRDFEPAVEFWRSMIGAGPFFVADNVVRHDVVYRGAPTKARYTSCVGFSGSTQIELIRPDDDEPSVFKEILDARGEGFHHLRFPVRGSFEAELARFTDAGFKVAMQGITNGLRAAYVDTLALNGGFIEIFEENEAMKSATQLMINEHRNWDGHTDPIRRRAPAPAARV